VLPTCYGCVVLSSLRIIGLLSLALWAPALPLACAGKPAASAPAASEAPSAAVPVASTTTAPAPAAVPASASAAAVTCPPGQTLGADGSCAAPCVDGELLMGTCICPHGKGADITGHCVLMPCPKSTSGGTVFRNDAGQCVECRAGAIRSGDGCLK
jgi:hypothetical protein